MGTLSRLRFNKFYVEHWTDDCIYCGWIATTWDHIPPIKDIEIIGVQEDVPMVMVRACVSCNSALCDRSIYTIRERRDWLIKKLEGKIRRNYAKVLTWTEEELNKLGRNLRSSVSARIRKGIIISGRLQNMKDRNK